MNRKYRITWIQSELPSLQNIAVSKQVEEWSYVKDIPDYIISVTLRVESMSEAISLVRKLCPEAPESRYWIEFRPLHLKHLV